MNWTKTHHTKRKTHNTILKNADLNCIIKQIDRRRWSQQKVLWHILHAETRERFNIAPLSTLYHQIKNEEQMKFKQWMLQTL
jgi:hypothetical protein